MRFHCALSSFEASYLPLLIIISLLWLPLTHADERPSGIPGEAKYVKVDRVIDGDTIVLMDGSRVRLEGIDAPERDQPYGPTATAALEYMVGRSVYYVETDKDRYERMLAWDHKKQQMGYEEAQRRIRVTGL